MTPAELQKELEQLREGCYRLRLKLSPTQEQDLLRYCQALLAWNTRMNLISRRDESRIVTHHILDSLSAAPYLRLREGTRVLDAGTGGGLPGIPLKVYEPSFHLTLVDSTRKKTLFLRKIAAELKLPCTEVICDRLENLVTSHEHRASYHYVLARAVARLEKLVPLTFPFLLSGGTVVAYKGANHESEEAAALPILEALGACIAKEIQTFLPAWRKPRTLLLIRRGPDHPGSENQS